MPLISLDHVILAVNDLESSAARFRQRFGLASLPGGRHPAWGTANRIVPLGQTYLELMGIGDDAAAQRSPLGRRVSATSAGGDAWLSWVLRVDDVVPEAQRLGLAVAEGSRERPDGTVLSWRIAGLEVAGDRRLVAEWVGGELPWVRFVPGAPGLRAVAVGPPEAEIVIRADL